MFSPLLLAFHMGSMGLVEFTHRFTTKIKQMRARIYVYILIIFNQIHGCYDMRGFAIQEKPYNVGMLR